MTDQSGQSKTKFEGEGHQSICHIKIDKVINSSVIVIFSSIIVSAPVWQFCLLVSDGSPDVSGLPPPLCSDHKRRPRPVRFAPRIKEDGPKDR